MTGEQQFLKYAWPCAEERLRRKLITREQFDELKQLVETNGHPSREFLAVCFPGAVRRLNGKWSLSEVSQYWHEHCGPEGAHCNVRIREVFSIFGRFVRLYATLTEPNCAVLNEYGLDLKEHDQIYVHLFTAIEKVE